MKDKLKNILLTYKNEKDSSIYKAIEKLIDSEDSSNRNDITKKYNIFFNNSQLAFQSLDINGNILEVNQTWLDILRYNKNEVIGKSFANFVHPDLINIFNARFKKFKKEGNIEDIILKLKKKNGKYILASYESCVLYNENNDSTATYCSFRDVTNETKILNELKESEEKYKKLIHNQGEGIGITNKDEIFTFSNHAADKIFGVKKGGLIGKSLAQFLSIEEQEKIKIETSKRKKSRQSSYELEINNFKGVKKHILVTVTPNNDDKGNYLNSFGIFRDITSRKQIEQELKESEDKFKAITNSSQDAIILLDDEGLITFWNHVAEKIFQYTSEEVINKDLHKLITLKKYRSLFEKGFANFKNTGKGRTINNVVELSGVRKDGADVPVELSLSALRHNNKWYSVGIIRDITERKENEITLTQSEERFRTIFEMNTDLIGIANMETATFFKVNPTFTKTLGYKEEEFLKKPFLEFIHPDDIDKTKEVIESELKKGKKVIRFVNRYHCKEGGYRILEWKAYPVLRERILYAVAHDITRRTEDERRLKESEERFKNLSEVSFEGIVMHKNGIAIDCNQTLYNVTDYTKEEIINQSLFKIIHEKHHALIAEKIKQQSTKPYEVSIVKKDGTEVPVEIESRSFKLNNEDIRVSAVRDITERKEVQQKIIENEKRFRTYIETSPVGIFIANRYGKLNFVNSTAQKLLGYSQKEMLNMTILDIHLKEDALEVKKKFGDLQNMGQISSYETRFMTKYGKIINIILESIKLSKNEYIAFCTNNTEQKSYEAKLKELNATKDKFFSIIAHDLRAPMNNLVGFSDLLLNKHSNYSKEKLSYIIGMMNSSAKQTFSLLENLLIWSKSQRGKLSFKPTEYTCKEIIEEIIEEMQHFAIAKEIKIESQKEHNESTVLIDKEMFKTIFRNLISNAIKFTYEGGKISIGCKKIQNRMVKFFVSDTGVGIPEEKQDKLFRIDQNISTPGTKNEQGTGLGLLLCKEFVEKHGGKIWVESIINNDTNNKTSGSTFYFTVPCIKKNN